MNDDGKNKKPDAAPNFDLGTFIGLIRMLMRSQRINDEEKNNSQKNTEENPKSCCLLRSKKLFTGIYTGK